MVVARPEYTSTRCCKVIAVTPDHSRMRPLSISNLNVGRVSKSKVVDVDVEASGAVDGLTSVFSRVRLWSENEAVLELVCEVALSRVAAS